MALYLGILLFSFILTSLAIIPFIDLLYRLHLTSQKTLPVEVDEITHSVTPVGGGVIIISVVSCLFLILFPVLSRFGVFIRTSFPLKEELNLIFFTFVSFGLLGLFDDIVKIFHLKFRNPYKHPLEIALSAFVAALIFLNLGIRIINLPPFGVFSLGWLFIPMATFVIYTFVRGCDITDGLDGLAGGVLLISLLAFWTISVSLLDTPISVFVALWTGSLIAFLYFNIYPSRIWMGNSGSLSFGATLAVIGLILGKTGALLIIGAIFLLEGGMNMLQTIWRLIFKHNLFSVAPIHYYLQSKGWPEPKVVFRLWLASTVFALLGLWLSYS